MQFQIQQKKIAVHNGLFWRNSSIKKPQKKKKNKTKQNKTKTKKNKILGDREKRMTNRLQRLFLQFYTFIVVEKVVTKLLLSGNFCIISGVKFAGNSTLFDLFVSSIVR